ncbi:D-alanine--D-alanine ligase [Alphaproteobacteria bacterium]|nr:D-alanine--D-alanine ligase [Alphaproteobacteria bacterium]
MRIKNKIHVLLVKGGYGSEREVSLKSADVCAKILRKANFKVTEFDIATMKIVDLVNIKADICFNALHGDIGENGSLQGFLNLIKLPYTHSGVEASAIAMNKIHFKRIITNATENTSDPIYFPETLKLTPEGKLHNKEFSGPYIIKPIKGGSSVGVKIIRNPMKNSSFTLDHKELMAEIYVGSKELTVTVLKNKPLCVTEIEAQKNETFYNYNAKYEKNGSLHTIPAKIPAKIYEQSMSWALKAHNIIGCKGISRSDFRYDDKNKQLYLLELNTQPGMTDTSLSPEQALYCGISFEEMVTTLIEEADYEC